MRKYYFRRPLFSPSVTGDEKSICVNGILKFIVDNEKILKERLAKLSDVSLKLADDFLDLLNVNINDAYHLRQHMTGQDPKVRTDINSLYYRQKYIVNEDRKYLCELITFLIDTFNEVEKQSLFQTVISLRENSLIPREIFRETKNILLIQQHIVYLVEILTECLSVM